MADMGQSFPCPANGQENTEVVGAQLQNGVLRLTLNRPEKLNAFNEEMHLALRAQLERARDDTAVRAVLLTGAGRGFCAGQDLGDRNPKAATRKDLGHTLATFYHPTLKLIRRLEQVVVCAVNGVAAGSGANLALSCDIVIAAKSAKFIQSFSKIGLVPDTGGSWLLPHYLGEPRAKALALTGEPLSAERAADWGLIWKAVDDSDLMVEAGALAQRLADGPSDGLALTKELINRAATNSWGDQLIEEREVQRKLGFSEDYAEGVTAFLEKRTPVYRR